MSFSENTLTSRLLDRIGDEFTFEGVKFRYLSETTTERTTTEKEVLILKHAPMLAMYDAIFRSPVSKNVIEFGIAEAGSILLFALAFPNLKFVGIDLRAENPAVLGHIDRLGLSDRVKLYYRTSQSDDVAVSRIIEENFGGEPIGVVIDDASHFYNLSRKTFELTFGRLAPNGVYCLEDWQWSHQDAYQKDKWADQPSLTNLVFDLVSLVGSRPDIASEIDLRHVVAFVKRGRMPTRKDALVLDNLLKLRGKNLVKV